MKRYTIKPLQADYIYVPISATELEHFACPTPEYQTIKIDKDDEKYKDNLQMKDEIFAMWSYVESIIQATLMWGREMWYSMAKRVRECINPDFSSYKRSIKNKEWEFMYNNLEKYVDENMELYHWEWWYNTTNFRQHCFVECWKYLFYFSWEVDTARFYGGDDDIIIDHKLSSSEWKDDTLARKRQRYYYPFLTFLSQPDMEKIDFIYNVNRKLKNIEWKTQFILEEVSRETATDVFVKDICAYATALYNGTITNEHIELDIR